ncbi:unnamed protein product [Cylindrotheca closterium]|uniref:Uncharacterized protein n=1 Tax=Cylindrotheca closterium TaxID=2856 RepID=A0AAD2FPG6_9STRA|nr:unnamed protein product [Cylindrotheca closterium]
MKFFLCRIALLCSLLALPVQSFGGVDAFFRTSPYAAAAMVCGMKGVCADFVAQKHQFKKNRENGDDMVVKMNRDGSLVTKLVQKIDLKRSAAFLIYGALYQGLVLEYSYNHIYPRLFGPGQDVLSVLRKVSFDMFFQSPCLTLPSAYISKAFVFGNPIGGAVRKYVDDVIKQKLLLKYYVVWVPVMFFAFGVVPDRFRVTFCASVSFFWMMLLSAIANNSGEESSSSSSSSLSKNSIKAKKQ